MPPTTTLPTKKNSTSRAVASSPAERKKFTPRPPRSKEERLPSLFRALTDQVDGGHFAGAIKTSRKILHLDPTSLPAFQTLLFLHLHTDDYAAALSLLDNPPAAATSLEFERAYCLYRLHREKEALGLMEKLQSDGRKEKHLEAQIRYRLGEYQRTQELYDELLSTCDSSSSEHPDIVDNLSATSTHLEFLSHGYHSALSAPAAQASSDLPHHTPTEGELETYVPSLPTGWATGGVQTKKPAVPVKLETVEKKKKKSRHALPKGAVSGKPANEDPDRWLPMRQRASYLAVQSKKKGVKESMGTGFTQGSTSSSTPSGGGGGGGGGKNKKGKKK